MEVHRHTHTARKKWTHYFWEFFMLFMAVTLGFFVENQREHYVEGKRKIEYIHSIAEDLKADVVWTTEFIKDQGWSVNAYDSVITLLNQEKRTEDQQRRLYYLVRMAMRMSWPNEANRNAYEQMKNSGNLRLLHKKAVADSISEYYFFLDKIGYITSLITLRQQAVTEYEAKIFDGSVLQQMTNQKTFEFSEPEGYPALINNNDQVINEFKVRIHYLASIMIYSINYAKEQQAKAVSLLNFLQQEYNLK